MLVSKKLAATLAAASLLWANAQSQPAALALPLLTHKQKTDNDDSTDSGNDSSKNNASAPSADKNSAPCLSWVSPSIKPRLALLCIHGLGLYSGSYANFGTRMANHGIATYAIDVRGFGSWMKDQGHSAINFDSCLDDIRVALQAIHAANPGLPVFLLGESMGGAIALRAASLYPNLIDGLISSVPAGERFKQKKTDLQVALEMFKGFHHQFDIGKEIVSQATTNEKLAHDWSDDPLSRMDLSPKELLQFQSFMNDNHDAAKLVKSMPVLFVQGTEDRLVKPEGTWDLFNELSTTQKYFMAVPSEHLIYEEGQDKSIKFDQRIVRLTSAWIYMQAFDSAKATLANLANSDGKSANDADSGVYAVGDKLAPAVQALTKGDFDTASAILQKALTADPNDAEVHYWQGMLYSREKKPLLAHQEMAKAILLGHGSLHSQQANNYLLASGTADDAEAGAGPQANQGAAPVAPEVKALVHGVPTVLVFSANWAEQCQSVDQFMKRAHNLFGNKVNLVKIDVDDQVNAPLVKALNVGPVPTVVYLDSTGKTVSTSIGRTTFINFSKGIDNLFQ